MATEVPPDMKCRQALTLHAELEQESSQNWDWAQSQRPEGGTDLTVWMPVHRSGQGQGTGKWGWGKFITRGLPIS